MFYKKVNYKSNRDMFEFLKGHFKYSTLNSWNKLNSIANNVKVYNLNLTNKDYDVLDALEEDDYFSINETIKEWESGHPGFKVGFNGRSGGYLVLYNDKDNGHCFNRDNFSPCFYNNYEAWKEDIKEYYGSLKDYNSQLVEQVKVVQDFDKLCDDLVILADAIADDFVERRNNTHEFKATKTSESYTYESALMKERHKQHMLSLGYEIISEDKLTCLFSTNTVCTGEVILDEGPVNYEKE